MTQEKTNSIINALKRLDRAGDENSKATEKLKVAASEVADRIIGTVPIGVSLPRNYTAVRCRSNVGTCEYLIKDYEGTREEWINGYGGYMHGDFNCWIPDQTRQGVLQFARDVSEGLIDEIAKFLEKRKRESESGEKVLTKIT